MAIDALYRTIRSAARQLARRDSLAVIWAYSQFLQVNDFQIPQDIEVAHQFRDARPRQGILAEWTLEHLAREVIRYGDEEARDGKSLRRWDTLAHLANTLRDLEGEIYRDLVGAPHIQLEMMRIMHRQFVWQQLRFNWTWIIRYYKLFNTPALTAHAEQATGLSIDQIYLIGMCYLGHFFEQPRWIRRVQVEIPGLNDEHVERFLAFTSLTRAALAEKLRAEHALDEGFAYRYSSLRAYCGLRLPGIRRRSSWHTKLPRHSPGTRRQHTSSVTTIEPSAAYSDAASRRWAFGIGPRHSARPGRTAMLSA